MQIRHNHAALFGPEKTSSLQTSVHYITAVIISKVLCDTDSQEEESQNKRLHYILTLKNIEKNELRTPLAMDRNTDEGNCAKSYQLTKHVVCQYILSFPS